MPRQRSLELTQESVRQRGLVRDGIHFPYNPHNVERAKKMRKNMTDAESKVRFGYLRKADHKRYRQKCIDHFIVDFYCPEVNLVLEIDGDTHAGDDAQNYDAMRSQLIELYGLQIIRVTNSDVYKKFDDVCCYISDCVDEVCN